jgi:methylenetetrahydrofolate dehydrogenase (NADP+) / methenyltetrahydrofolate cyclohydrolase
MSQILDGAKVAKESLERTAARVRALVAAGGVVPCLATVLCGDDPASATYVKMKAKRCEAVGMRSLRVDLPAATTTAELVARIAALGADPGVHGILLQHPVPRHIDERAAFEAIPPSKDVDGVTIHSLGAMALGLPGFAACTPAGIMRLLAAYQVPLSGRRAIVIGRSPILGKPMAYLLTGADATVTLAHSRTRDLPALVAEAELVVAAVGKARFVHGEWVREGAVVVDAGYNEGNVGDVDYEPAAARASLITPVPGGVGPMTIATLIEQTATAAERLLRSA